MKKILMIFTILGILSITACNIIIDKPDNPPVVDDQDSVDFEDGEYVFEFPEIN